MYTISEFKELKHTGCTFEEYHDFMDDEVNTHAIEMAANYSIDEYNSEHYADLVPSDLSAVLIFEPKKILLKITDSHFIQIFDDIAAWLEVLREEDDLWR